MRRSKERILFAGFILFLFLTGCKSSKKTIGTVELGTAKAHTEFFDEMQKKAFQFTTLSSRLHVDVKTPGQEISSRVDLKMVKDSAFQLSVQPFLGVEVFRIELTLDSIKIVDRMNRRYVAENYASLKGQTPVEFNFYNLQALFINQLFLPGQQRISPKQYNKFKLEQEGAMAEIKTKDSMGLLYTFRADGEEKLLSTFVTDAASQYALQWIYADFKAVGKQIFPMLMDVQVLTDGISKGGIVINWGRIQTDASLNMDFSIPSRYKRITFVQILKSISNSNKNSS